MSLARVGQARWLRGTAGVTALAELLESRYRLLEAARDELGNQANET